MAEKPEDDLQDFLDQPGQAKAKLDDSVLSDELPKGLQKVDLDLDDAPFLMDEEEEAKPAAEAPPVLSTEPEAAEGEALPWWKKKVILAAAAGVLLLLAGGGTWFFFLREKPAPPPPPQETAAYIPEPQVPPPPPPPEELTVALEPFLLEQADAKGRPSLLAVKFSLVTTDPLAVAMISQNARVRLLARDAVHYYLSNKSFVFLTDRKNADILKKEVLDVVNAQMSGHDFERVLLESYLGM